MDTPPGLLARLSAGDLPSRPDRDRRATVQLLLDVLAMARPAIWPVSLLPYAVGLLLATHRLVPAGAQLRPAVTGGLVTGPLVWLAVLAVNDAYDLAGDRANPRKAGTPLVSGRMSVRAALTVSSLAGAVAVLVAAVVSLTFAAGALLALALGWAYSAPPLRLKTRAGLDAVLNALAIGTLGPLAGWSAVHSVGGFPWVMAVQGTLVGVALYVPSALVDYRPDLASGFGTVAVRLGRHRAYLVGLAAWTGAALLSVVLALTDEVIPRRMLAFEIVLVPGLVTAYHLLLHRRQSVGRIVAVATLFLVPSGLFALTYTGIIG